MKQTLIASFSKDLLPLSEFFDHSNVAGIFSACIPKTVKGTLLQDFLLFFITTIL